MPSRIPSNGPVSPPAPTTTPAATPLGTAVPAANTGWTRPSDAPAAPTSDGFSSGRGAGPVLAPSTPVANLATKAKDKLVSVLWNEITKEHSISLASIPLGDRGAIGLRAFEKVILPSDPLVANDPHRAAYEATASGRHSWARTGGVMDGNVGLSLPVSLGSAGGGLGFSSNGALEYSVLAPYGVNGQGALELGQNLTTDLPVTSQNAREMARGSEFTLRGRGSVGASASLGVGSTVSAAALSAGVSAGASGSLSASGEITLNVKRLEGEKVFVRLGKSDAASIGSGVSVNAGVTANRDWVGDQLGLPANAVGSYLEKTASREVAKQVEDVLRFQAGASVSASRDSQQVAAFVLDLQDPQARQAYEALVKLDTGPATRLASQGQGVRALYSEQGRSTISGANLQIGPAKLFLMDSLRRDREGTLEDSGGTLVRKDSVFRRSTDGLLTDKKSVTWEGVTFQRNSEAPQTFFHLTFQKKDDYTRAGEVDSLQRFAKGIDAAYTEDPVLKRDKAFFRRLFNGSYGETTTKLDVYFTREGLQKVSQASEEQLVSAFATAAQALEGSARPPAWSVPSTAAESREMLREYANHFTPASGDDDQARLVSDYKRKFGRDIGDDAADLESANLFARNVGSMRNQPEPEWVKAFAELGAQARFDMTKHLTALNALAGADNTLVHELSVTGDRVKLNVRDEGLIANPVDAEVGRALSPP